MKQSLQNPMTTLISKELMRYTKMHGAGNGFVLIDNTDNALSSGTCRELAVRLCKKEKTDGFIAVCPAEDADIGMLFINSDGSVGEMCGNGARCLAKYAAEHGLVHDTKHISIKADAGTVTARRISDDLYEVRLNDPALIDPHRHAHTGNKDFDCFYTELGDPGIPHAVVFTDIDPHAHKNELRETARAIRHAQVFPKGANVSFVLRTGPDSAKAITFERGVEDFTLACGTGCGAIACAIATAYHGASRHVYIEMPGGLLEVSLSCEGDLITDILLTGPAVTVGEGETSYIS